MQGMDVQMKNMRGNKGLIGMYTVQGLSLTCWWLGERKKGQEREHHGHIRACTGATLGMIQPFPAYSL